MIQKTHEIFNDEILERKLNAIDLSKESNPFDF